MQVNTRESFVMAKNIFEEAHKLTPDNIKNEDDWRKMSDKEWDKLIAHFDKYLDATRENLEELKEKQEEAAKKTAAEAPANMKSIMAAQAALQVAANGFTNDTVETTGDFGTIALVTAGENTCPYSYLASDGVIEYNGVTFVCDYKNNAISLGDVTSDPSKVLNIPLPSGGNLYVNVDNFDDLAKAAGMFSPKDLNAILRAMETYKHCSSKIKEIEDEENKSPEEIAQERAGRERNEAAEQMKMTNESIYQRLMSEDYGYFK